MYWRDIIDERNDGGWRGLLLHVSLTDRVGRPPLHVQAGRRRLLRLESLRRPVLWARHSGDHYGYGYLRADHAERGPSVVAPTPFERARAFDPASPTWIREWARFFAESLRDSGCSPLHAGLFSLAPCPAFLGEPAVRALAGRPFIPPACRLGAVPKSPPHGYAHWDFGPDLAPLPLRAFSEASDGRVKAFRKLAREGFLPPVFLWWICGLQRYVILDGHDRLLAALLEAQVPSCLALLGLREEPHHVPPSVIAAVVHQVEAHGDRGEIFVEARREGGRLRGLSVDQANRLLIDVFDDRPALRIATRAWPLSGGVERWRLEVNAELERQHVAEQEAEALIDEG